ncbi:MAG: hypothetical protein QOE61_5097 [Micromonosporaceae bacterium]|jgi:hypothetical protein|nr:hypothetical protein [Micromonosporaceae bacterium]
MHPLVTEAMKKAAVAWLGLAERAPYPVWCLWVDDALFVVSGPGEQPAPGLAEATTAAVTARGDHGGRIITWSALVERVLPDSDTWASVVAQLAGKRLNSASTAELAQRWARDCVVTRLTPTDEPPAERPEGSLAAPPRPTPAVRVARKPFRLHRVKKP